MNLQKEINLNKKFILIFVLINIIALGLYYSYALFQVNVIKDNVIVINTATINLTVNVVGENVSNNTFTLASGEIKKVTVNLSSNYNGEIGYKLYYTSNNDSEFQVTASKIFLNDIVQGKMTTTESFELVFNNTGASSKTFTLGGVGGIASYSIPLENGKNEIILSSMDGSDIVRRFALKRATETDSNEELCKTYIEEDGIIYISGTKECIDFNYVWWSGKMWRVTAIYPDGSMKMITDNNISIISFGTNNVYYNKTNGTKSFAFQWLNEDFKDTLYNNGTDIIDTTKSWNATMPATTDASSKPAETAATMIPATTSPIGLLNSYEYYKSYQNVIDENEEIDIIDGYLNSGYDSWILNPYNSSDMWMIQSVTGSLVSKIPDRTAGMRPAIYVKSGINFSGVGTKSSPYRIENDYSDANTNDKINTRHSGEYVLLGNKLHRIVGIDGTGDTATTKVVAMDYATYDDNGTTKNTKAYASSVNFGASGNTKSNTYWDYYLNRTWYDNLSYKDMIVSGTYYIGTVDEGKSYKLSVCKTASTDTTATCLSDSTKRVTTTFTGNVGLLRYGEMFANQQGEGGNSSIDIWSITASGDGTVLGIQKWGNIYKKNANDDLLVPSIDTYGVRPAYYIHSSLKILSGTGKELDPYVLTPPTTYSITYNSRFQPYSDGTNVNTVLYNDDTTNIYNGSVVTPTNDCNTFDGWYVDEELTTPFDINDHINQDMTVYAKYTGNEFCYNAGAESTFIAYKDTSYKLEVWGGQGGQANAAKQRGGYGGYSTGTISLSNSETLYINAGGRGVDCAATKATTSRAGGYNGGGSAATTTSGSKSFAGGSGGGATHIAFSTGLLSTFSDATKREDLIIVAGGGGGGYYDSDDYAYASIGGSGGGSTGGAISVVNNGCNKYCVSYKAPTGGTQTAGGNGMTNYQTGAVSTTTYIGRFGQGATGTISYGGGGGGYYGGGSGAYVAGGGGSGYLNTTLLTNYSMSCFTGCSGDNTTTVTSTGAHVANTANTGAGYAKITVN